MIIDNYETMQVMDAFVKRNAFVVACEYEKKEEFVRELQCVNRARKRVEIYSVTSDDFVVGDTYMVCCISGSEIYWEDIYHNFYAVDDKSRLLSDKLRIGYMEKAYVPALIKVRLS